MQSQEKSKDGLKKKLFGGFAAVVVVVTLLVERGILKLGTAAVRATDEVAVGVSKLATPEATRVGTGVAGAAARAAAQRANDNGAGTRQPPPSDAPRGVAP